MISSNLTATTYERYYLTLHSLYFCKTQNIMYQPYCFPANKAPEYNGQKETKVKKSVKRYTDYSCALASTF